MLEKRHHPLTRVGILAGESSGDILGAGLMSALKALNPTVRFEGIGGPLMTEQGLDSRVPMERLSVMGFIEPLKRLPELLRIRRELGDYFLNDPPDIFIGIDSPDFNLDLERRLRAGGIKTAHYVSPSVWAWRRGRIHKIRKAVDLMLTLFPFEADIYQQHNIPVAVTGHPLADTIDLQVDTTAARVGLGLVPEKPVLALLPGSREGEVERMAPAFLGAARLCLARRPELQIVLPCANENRKRQLEAMIESDFNDIPVRLLDGQSRQAMAAAGMILIASGTATLEALLFKKPMLVTYRMGAVSFAIISRLLKVPYFSLPNLLAGKALVEELVQDDVNPQHLFERLEALFGDTARQQALVTEYERIHRDLRRDASHQAALALMELLAVSEESDS